jgi:hypothetical protein
MSDETTIDQPAAESVEDKIAARFQGHPQTETAPAEPIEETSELADLEWDGKTYQVPKTLKDGFLRNEDYTRKTQELAEQRKSVEVVRSLAEQRQTDSAFQDSIAQEAQELSVIDAYLKQAERVDWSNMTTDQMLKAKIEIDRIKDRKSELKSSVEGKRGAFQEQMKQRMVEMRGKAREIASKSIQGFSEDTEKEMTRFAVSEGLTEQEVERVLLDPRSYTLVWKAMQFDKVQAGTKTATASAARVLKPGVASERPLAGAAAKSQFDKAMSQAKNSGDKARVIEQRLAGMFAKGR